jgi:hypothetical protein
MMSENEIVLLSGKLAANAWTRIRNRERGNELNRVLYENMIGSEMCGVLLKIREEAEQCEAKAAECSNKLQALERRLRTAKRILGDALKSKTISATLRGDVEKFLGLKKKQQQSSDKETPDAAMTNDTATQTS